MSELFDKQVNAWKEKIQIKMKKRCTCEKFNIIDGRSHFIRCIWKTGGNELYKICVNDSGHNEGTTGICLVNGWISAKRMVFKLGHTDRCH